MDDKKKTTILLYPDDEAYLDIIKEKYGVKTDNAAIRLALRVAAQKPKSRTKKETPPVDKK